MDAELGILGAGASGLSLALLTDLDYRLIEQGGTAGGHASSTIDDGWVFDRGPHIMFSRDDLLLECMVASLGDNVHRCRRKNRVAIEGTLARYPIENDLAALPLPLRADALVSFLQAEHEAADPHNLAEWFDAHFGKVLVAAYFRPYNEKVWNVPLEQLSMGWSDRIPSPPMEDVVRGALGEQSEGYLHQLYYSYPRTGGYGALMQAWASGIPAGRAVYDHRVERIVPTTTGVRVESSAAVWEFARVVSTLPLDVLVELVPDVPVEVARAVSRLVVNPMLVVTLGYRGEDADQYTAVYIPDDDFLVNRISFPAVFSPENAPPGCFSIQAEITASPSASVLNWSDEEVIAHVLEGLQARSLVPEGAVLLRSWVDRYDRAYVVYTQDYEADLEVARAWFDARGIVIHGRFGAHEYVNVDGCLGRSIELARRLGTVISDAGILERFKAIGARP